MQPEIRPKVLNIGPAWAVEVNDAASLDLSLGDTRVISNSTDDTGANSRRLFLDLFGDMGVDVLFVDTDRSRKPEMLRQCQHTLEIVRPGKRRLGDQQYFGGARQRCDHRAADSRWTIDQNE